MQVLAYHGSPHRFEKFSFENVGKEGGTTGAGFGIYFSTSKADALTYGENIYTCMLQLKTNVDNHKVTFQPQILKAILDKAETEGHSYYENYGIQNIIDKTKNNIIKELISHSDSDVEILGDIIISSYGGKCDDLLKITDSYGFSHTLDKESPDSPDILHYIVYDLNAITIQKVENLNEL